MDPISVSAIASGIAWVGKVAWKVYQKYNDLKKEAEQKANEYWNKIKTRATGSMLVINGFLGPVFGVISTTLGISLSLAASVFTFVVAMVGIGFTTGLMWGLKPRSHNWKEEKKLNYVKNPKLILQYGYHLLYKKILYYWLKFGVHIVRFGVPVLFGLLAAIGAATPIGWAAIGVVAATMVVGFGIGLGAGYLVGKHYRYDPDAKKDDINEQKIDNLKDDLNELDEQEQEQLDKLIDLGLGDKLRFAPQRAYGLNEFSPESLITLLLLKNNGALPESNQPANQGLDEVEEKLPDHIARINDYYNPGVRLLALSGAINSDRDLIKGPAFVENFHAYVKQERDVIEAMQKYQVQNKDLKGHYDKVQKELNAANDLVTLEAKASEKFEQLKNKYKDIEIDQRNGLVLWDGSLLGHIDDPQFIREIESGELKYIDDKGVEQTFMVNQKEDTKRKELAKALGDYWSACEAVSSKLKSASFIGAQGHGFIIPDECGPELNNYRYFSYAMLKRQAQLYFPAFKDVHARIEDAIKENKESDQIGWGLNAN